MEWALTFRAGARYRAKPFKGEGWDEGELDRVN